MKKEKFKLENYAGNYAMRIKSEREDKLFRKYLEDNGRTWESGELYTSRSYFRPNKYLYMYFNLGTYSNFYPNPSQKTKMDKVLNIDDFEWSITKSDLKLGDIVVFDKLEPNVGIYIPSNAGFSKRVEGMEITVFLDEIYSEDLTPYKPSSNNHIKEIYRPSTFEQMSFEPEMYKKGTLIFSSENTNISGKIYSNGNDAETNHRLMWELLASNSTLSKIEALAEIGISDYSEVRCCCFACDYAKSICNECPLNSTLNRCSTTSLYDEWSMAEGFEKCEIAYKIAKAPWDVF